MKRPVSKLSDDRYLDPYRQIIASRREASLAMEKRLTEGRMSLADFAAGHEYFGLHREGKGWIFREWAPTAEAIYLVGAFSEWEERDAFALQRINSRGEWELRLPSETVHHGDLYKLRVHWAGGMGERLPAYARRVVQDSGNHSFCAQVWEPPEPYTWKHESPTNDKAPLIYEVHVGMAQEKAGIGTFTEFRQNVLPRLAPAGYNTLQLMAVMEHPYYGSFGYHVSNFFAASSRFGTPDELKALVDAAHGEGLRVIMDLVHSHAVRNELEGLSRFDGTPYQYFHEGARGYHAAWDSRCFDYGKPAVLHFLLSNCRFWLDEYHFDGFRFDGVTSMLYLHHGMGPPFVTYDDYFCESVDEDALVYLTLANKLIHTVSPHALTIAEDVSGMPGLGAPIQDGGYGFDYRLAMGIPDCWFKLIKDVRDEDWNLAYLWHELTNRRVDERTVSYAESHDQAIVGGKSIVFQLIDAPMYSSMRTSDRDVAVERGVALHKMIRLATLATAGHGYLNFIGNEFGHPEWVDFPRQGNNWSYHYARRQWQLRDDPQLQYHFLGDFDRAMLDIAKRNRLLETDDPRLLLLHNDDKVFALERGALLFVFNFHPNRSFTDYGIEADGDEYRLLLDTDEARFGGQERLSPGQHYSAIQSAVGRRTRRFIRLYLPARTALVLEKAAA